MRRLIVIVTRATSCEIGQQVKCKLAIVLRVLNLLMILFQARSLAVELSVGECPWLTPLRDVRDEATMSQAKPETFLEATLEVAAFLELLGNPR